MITWQSSQREFFGSLDVVNLNAEPSKVCRFGWSEHDQANLDIVCSEIGKLYLKVLEKAGSKTPMSQMTRNFNLSDSPLGAEKVPRFFTVEPSGSNSSAPANNPTAAGSKKRSGHKLESSTPAKKQNPKASVSKSPSEEELEFHPLDKGKSAR